MYAQSNFLGYAAWFDLASNIVPSRDPSFSYCRVECRFSLVFSPVVLFVPMTISSQLQEGGEMCGDNTLVKNLSTANRNPRREKPLALPTKRLLREQNTRPDGLCLGAFLLLMRDGEAFSKTPLPTWTERNVFEKSIAGKIERPPCNCGNLEEMLWTD